MLARFSKQQKSSEIKRSSGESLMQVVGSWSNPIHRRLDDPKLKKLAHRVWAEMSSQVALLQQEIPQAINTELRRGTSALNVDIMETFQSDFGLVHSTGLLPTFAPYTASMVTTAVMIILPGSLPARGAAKLFSSGQAESRVWIVAFQ